MTDPDQKLLLFDFDGVLVDSLDVYEGVVRQCLEAIGKPIISTRADYLTLYQDNFYGELARRGIDLSAFLAELAKVRPHIDTSLIKPLPAMASVLSALAERHRLMLISSNSADVIQVLLTRMNISGCFEAVLGAEFLLDKTEKIVHARKTSGFAKEDVYYVGDTAGDIREARRAGIKSVAVTWGWHERDTLEAVSPDFLIDTPQALFSLLMMETPASGRSISTI
ncbi:MAG: Phosphoglycolate phosphatase [Syntrophus sp. PtaU1.Bin208]|nr:MAG: Phosphoglycolate phosphatase [Syntrophus sp. PtaU1.Bin208]